MMEQSRALPQSEVMNKKEILYCKVFTVFVCLMPILCAYRSFTSNLNLGETILLVFAVIALIRRRFVIRYRFFGEAVIFAAVILLSLPLSYISGLAPAGSVAWIRAIRYCIFLLVIFLLGNTMFRYDYAVRIIKLLGLLVSVIMILQFGLALVTGRVFRPIIASLIFEDRTISDDVTGRYSSVFIEPSYYGEYVILPLVFALFEKKKKAFDWVTLAVITAGILISTAGSAYISLVAAIFVFIFMNKQTKLTYKILIVLLAGLALYFGSRTESFRFVWDRLQNTDALGWRLNAYEVWQEKIAGEPFTLLFGAGYGNTAQFATSFTYNRWYPSAAYFMICIGFFGVAAFCVMLFCGYRRTRLAASLAIAVLMAAQAVYTDAWHVYFILYYLPFLYAFNRQEETAAETAESPGRKAPVPGAAARLGLKGIEK